MQQHKIQLWFRHAQRASYRKRQFFIYIKKKELFWSKLRFENEARNYLVAIESVNAVSVGQVSAKQRGRWHLDP